MSSQTAMSVQENGLKKTNAEYKRKYRARMKDHAPVAQQEDQLLTPIGTFLGEVPPFSAPAQLPRNEIYKRATRLFEKNFIGNKFGFVCDVCDRYWFENDLCIVPESSVQLLQDEFPLDDVTTFKVCKTCTSKIRKNKIPPLSRSNGFTYPQFPTNLPPLDLVTERLISPRLPFMQIRRLRFQSGSCAILGQVINVPVDVNNMVSSLPRQLDNDYAFNVSIKKRIVHKSSYLSGFVKMGTVKAWLKYLIGTPLYKRYNIKIADQNFLPLTIVPSSTVVPHSITVLTPDPQPPPALTPLHTDVHINNHRQPFRSSLPDPQPSTVIPASPVSNPDPYIETIETQDEMDLLLACNETLLWNEDKCLEIAPDQDRQPLSVIYDHHAEELSFPSIYLGHGRNFKPGVSVTPYMMAMSELRRRDRRGAKEQDLLYIAMKIFRLRVSDGLPATSNTTLQRTKSREHR